MPKRQVVPAALRDELTEYSSLLRALRTRHTLDVTAHLTQSQPSSEEPQSVASSANLKRKRSSSPVDDSPNNWRLRDQWTRWPLPASDVPPPDWTLQDEIASVVKQVLDTVEAESDTDSAEQESEGDEEEEENSTAEEEDSMEEDDIDDDEAYALRIAELLTPVLENVLTSLFALISAHTISRVDSLQNRIEPFSLQDFINILASPAASHLVDETMLQNLTTRINSIPDLPSVSTSTSVPAPDFDTALHRHRLATSSRSRINELLSRPTASIVEHPFPPSEYKYKGIRQIRALEKIKAENKKERESKKATRRNSRELTSEEPMLDDETTGDIDIPTEEEEEEDDVADDGDDEEQVQSLEEDNSDSEQTTSASDDER